MRNKMVLDGNVQYFDNIDSGTVVEFCGSAELSGQKREIGSARMEQLLADSVCKRKRGSTSAPEKVRITIEWD